MITLHKNINKVLNWIKYVEFGGAMIVMFVFGLLLGEVTESSLERVAELFSQIAGVVSIILGCAAVYFVQYDKRKSHHRIIIAAMAAVIVSNISLVFAVFSNPIVNIMVSFGGVLILVVLLQIAIDGYNNCKQCAPRLKKKVQDTH